MCEPSPALRPIDDLRSLKCDVQVTTFDSKVEPGVLILDEVECDLPFVKSVGTFKIGHWSPSSNARLREAFLLQICYNILTQQCRCTDYVQHILVIIAQKRKLETIFSRIESDRSWACGSVETMDCLAFDAREIDRVIQGTDDTVITG